MVKSIFCKDVNLNKAVDMGSKLILILSFSLICKDVNLSEYIQLSKISFIHKVLVI